MGTRGGETQDKERQSLTIGAVCAIQTDLQHGNSIIYPQIHKNEMSAW